MAMKQVELIGSPGIVRDTPVNRLPDNAFSDGENIRFNELGVETLAGDLETFAEASITPLWLNFFPPITAPKWVYANLTEVWVVENTTHTEITRTSGGDYSGVATQRWQSTVFNGTGILNNTVDIPQYWADFQPTTDLVNLPNWDTNRRAKSIRAFKNFLVALYLTDSSVEKPYRVLWSDSASAGTIPGSWDTSDLSTDAREIDLAETSDYLVDQLNMGDINVIYKENSTWGMQAIGPPFFFRFWKILSKKGLLHRDCVVNVPFGHLVVTQDDIIVHSGQMEQYESIIDDRMRRWLFQGIDPTNFRNSFLLANPRYNEAYFCWPAVGSTYADRALVWNWDKKSIGIKDITATPFAAVGPLGSAIDGDKAWG